MYQALYTLLHEGTERAQASDACLPGSTCLPASLSVCLSAHQCSNKGLVVMQTLKGMQDDAVGSAAATLLHQLLLHLKDDLVRATGQAGMPTPVQCATHMSCCTTHMLSSKPDPLP